VTAIGDEEIDAILAELAPDLLAELTGATSAPEPK
jgi:hypothetical protein